MIKRLSIYVLLISFWLPATVVAQTKSLSLEEALKFAEENNFANKSAKSQKEVARGSYQMTNSIFLPSISVSHSGVSTNDPLSAFGFKLKQEIVNATDFAPSQLNDPDGIESFYTEVEIQQPLLNMDGIYARKAAKNQYDAVSLQAERIQQNVRYQVKTAYYTLELTESSINVMEKSVRLAEEALSLTQKYEVQGLAKYADVLEAKVRLNERKDQLREAKHQLQTANEYLASLLGLDLNLQLKTTDFLSQTPPQQLIADLNKNIENRSDLKAYKKQVEASENMLKSERMKFFPRLNAFGTFELNDNKLLGASAQNYLVGASLSWNIFNGYKNRGSTHKANANLKVARINYQDYLSQSQIQLNKAKRELELRYQQIQSSKTAKEQSEESLRIRTDRFKQGLEKTTDLLTSEALSSQKNLEYIQSIYNYNQAVFEIELLLEEDINE